MCQCSNRDVVNTTFRIVAYRVEGNTTARFGLVTTTDNLHRLLRVGHGEVIEHDTVHATTVEHLLELIEVTHLDLYLQVETFFLEVCMTAVDGVGNTAGEIHMVILQQDHVEESDTVVHTTADLHSLFLQHTHTWGGLTGIQHPCMCSFEPFHITVGHRGNTAHPLHDVQHQAFCLKQRAHLSCYDHGHIPFLHRGAITNQHLHLHVGIKASKHPLCHLHASQNAVFLNQQSTLPHCILRDAAKSGMVAISDILRKRKINQSVFQFING